MVDKMATNISIFIKNLRISIKAQLMYPSAFIARILAQWVGYSAQFFTVWIMIRSFGSVNNWNSYEVIFIFAIQLISYAISSSFIANTLSDLPDMVVNGAIDDILIKPVNSLIYLISLKFNIGYISHLSLSIVMIIICWIELNIDSSILNFAFLFVCILSGTMISAGVQLIATLPSLFILGNNSLGQIIYDIRSFIHYPLSIFNKYIQFVFTFIIPYGFIGFYPSQLLLNKEDGIFYHTVLELISPIVGLTTLCISIKLWNWAINKYQSAGI